MRTHPTLDQLDDLIAARSILDHPFYQAWTAGALTRDQLAAYAAIYYPHVAAFPDHLRVLADGAADPAVAAELRDNLAEELGVPAPHPDLWLDFAAGLGLDRDRVAAAPAHPAADAIVDAFGRLARVSTAAGIAALYAYESQQPDVARRKAEGLRAFYEVDDPAMLAYFTVHAEADVRHRAGERDALARCLDAGASADEILAAASGALDAYWGLLDGVCEATGVTGGA